MPGRTSASKIIPVDNSLHSNFLVPLEAGVVKFENGAGVVVGSDGSFKKSCAADNMTKNGIGLHHPITQKQTNTHLL